LRKIPSTAIVFQPAVLSEIRENMRAKAGGLTGTNEAKVLCRLEQVSKSYSMGDMRVTALKDFSLDIHVGEILVVLGPSGSGKTTLLNLLGLMDRPDTGRVLFRGRV
jgi:putative ABC transport system ATP-binding protein